MPFAEAGELGGERWDIQEGAALGDDLSVGLVEGLAHQPVGNLLAERCLHGADQRDLCLDLGGDALEWGHGPASLPRR